MEQLPKLEVEGLGWDTSGSSIEFDQAKRFPYDSSDLIMVADGIVIRSYQDLLEVAREAVLSGKKSIKVVFLPMLVGG